MIKYSSFEEIDRDLKVHTLKRKIAIQEIKNLKQATNQVLSPSEWLNPTLINTFTKFGKLYLLKKIFK